MLCAEALDSGFGEFKFRNLSQGTATHVVAAFDPKLDGGCLSVPHFRI